MAARRVMTAEEARAAGFAPVEQAATPAPRRVLTEDEAKNTGFAPVKSLLPEEYQGLPRAEQEPDRDWFTPKSASGTALRSGTKGLSYALSDEIGGVMGASDELGRRGRTALGGSSDGDVPVENQSLSLKDAIAARYRRERGANRDEQKAGAAQYPRLAAGSEIAGSLLSPSPIGKGGGLVKMGMATGGLNALGDSDADLTKGDFGGAVRDTAGGMAAGGIVAHGLAPLTGASRGLSGSLINAADRVRADKMAKIEGVLDEEIGSARGKLGAASQAGNRTGENLQRTAQGIDPGAVGHAVVDPATQARALNALDRPDFKAFLSNVANHDVDNLPRRIADFQSAKDRLAQLQGARNTTAANQYADYFAPGKVMSEEVAPRLKTAAVNGALGAATGFATGAAGAAGAVLTGHSGAALPALGLGVMSGITAGMGGGTGLKRMLIGSRGLASSPRVQDAALRSVAGGLERTTGTFTGAATKQAGSVAAKRLDKDQRDEEAVQAWIDGG